MMAGTRLVALALLSALVRTEAAAPPSQRGAGADVLVFAAASLQTALDELAPAMQRATGATMRVSYAASSALARQIENGAPAEIFISADLDWMDYLDERKLVRAGTRVNLLGNRLVLIAGKGRPVALKIERNFPLAGALGRERLALANPDTVPAGKYAKAALTSLGVWDRIAPNVAAAENVRAALQLVARGEAPLGIVYRSDAIAETTVVVVDTFPETSHPPIVYPAALLPSASPAASTVLGYLRSDAARSVFERQGFTMPGPTAKGQGPTKTHATLAFGPGPLAYEP